MDKARELEQQLKDAGFRVKLDDSDNSAGWKFSEYEMKGVPLRLEIGPKDIEKGQCVLVTRHTREKTFAPLDQLESIVEQKLKEVHDGLYQKALENMEARTTACTTMEDILAALETKGDGFIKAMWCGDEACEDRVKEKDRCRQPLYPVRARAFIGCLRVLWKACQGHGILGKGLLKAGSR